jgi:acetoin utilization protein AcuB
MNLLAPITSIMTKNPITISPNDSLQTAQEIFDQHKIHHIPVVYEGILVGMLSKLDFSFEVLMLKILTKSYWM